MPIRELIFMIFTLLGGLALFIFGMRTMSSGLSLAVGSGMRTLLARATRNRFAGTGLGTVIGFLVQSSASTVLFIGFINAGLMTLGQSIAPMLGANIGTTLSVQLISFKLADYCLVGIFIGLMLHLISRNEKVKNGGLALLGTVGLNPNDQSNISLQLQLDSAMWTEIRKGMPEVPILTVDSTYRALGARLSRRLRFLLDGNSSIDPESREELSQVKNRLPGYLLVANALYDMTDVEWEDYERTVGMGIRYVQLRIDVYSLTSDERVWSQRIEHRMGRKSSVRDQKKKVERLGYDPQRQVTTGFWRPEPPSYLDMVGTIFNSAGVGLAKK